MTADRHACWRRIPLPHPLDSRITDVAGGYDDRLRDQRCIGCIRSRAESPRDQLLAIEGLGDVARAQAEPST